MESRTCAAFHITVVFPVLRSLMFFFVNNCRHVIEETDGCEAKGLCFHKAWAFLARVNTGFVVIFVSVFYIEKNRKHYNKKKINVKWVFFAVFSWGGGGVVPT